MAFHFSGRTFQAGDRLKLPSPSITPPGAGLIGLCRPTASDFFSRGFYTPGGASGWIMGRAPTTAANPNRLGLYRPLRTPSLQGSAAAGTSTCTTASFTPPANCTLIAFTLFRDTVNPANSTCVTGGLTWTLVPGADVAFDDGTIFLRQRAFSTTIGASPPAGITVQTTSNLADHSAVVVLAVPGGGAPSFQVATGTNAAGDATATLAAAPTASSVVLGSFHDRTFPGSITPPAGYTQAFFGNVGTNGKVQIAFDEDTTGAAVAWVTPGTLCTALAIEVKCSALIEHSSANWADNTVQSFLAFSASASEHYLALNSAGTLQQFSATVPIDTTSALALGTMDLTPARGAFTGEHFWIGVLAAMPPTGLLDQVMRQLQPPTVLRPWLAHLFPLTGRSPERCVLTNVALNVDSGTTIANVGLPQPQELAEEGPYEVPTGTSHRRVRVTARNASGNTVLTLDAGPSSQVAAIVVSLPAPGGTTGLGVAVNGGALTTASLPSAAPAQQGDLVVGTSILDGAVQSETATCRLGALAIGPVWNSNVHTALWAIASSYLRPIVDPIALAGEAGTVYIEDLAPRIRDPARAGYTLAIGGSSGGLTASIGGSSLSWSAAASGNYSTTLTITSLLSGLAPVTTVAISFAVALTVTRYANGYLQRAILRRPAWPGGGTEATLLLPFAELSERFKNTGNGGLIESSAGWDIRFEGASGQIAHRLVGYDGAGGRAAILLNLQQDLSTTEQIAIYLGKAGLLQSEENAALARQGGWVAWHNGWDLLDLTNLGHTLSDNGSIVASAIGSWPAAHFNGSNTWRQRASNELNAQAGFCAIALVQSDEAVGRSQEFLNIAPGGTAQLNMRLVSTGYWSAGCDVGGQLLGINSDTGLYVPGEPHAFCVSWTSGSAPATVLDGRLVEPATPPAVATGVTAMDEILEIGRGNRPPGASTYWNGPIGPVLLATTQQSQAQREVITAALKNPRLVYGLSDFQAVDDAEQPFMAMPLQGTAARGTSTSFNVVANAYNPGALALSVAVPQQPADLTATVSGDSIAVLPAGTAALRILLPYLLNSASGHSSSGVIDISVGAGGGDGGGGFNQSLPMGGLGVGAACLVGQPGNQVTTSSVIFTFRCEHSGSINRIQWNNRFNMGNSTGYSNGNGGTIHWTLRKVTNTPGIPSATGTISPSLALGPVLASTANVSNPIANAPWNGHFQAAGGGGSAPQSFARYPTMLFDQSVAVTAGDLLAFTHIQTGSSGNNVSVNSCYSTKHEQDNFSPYPYGKDSRLFRNGSTSVVRWEHYPVLLYGYTDDFVAGNPYQGYASGTLTVAEELILIGQGIRARQIFPMPSWANGKIVRRVHTFMCRYDNTTSADIRCRILTAGGTVGGSNDDGTLVASSTLAASGVRFEDNIKGTSQASDPIAALVFPFTTSPAAVTIQGGTSYYVELITTSGGGTRYNGHRLERVTEIATVGLRRPSCCFGTTMRSQRDTGSGWANLNSSGGQDLPLWVEFL